MVNGSNETTLPSSGEIPSPPWLTRPLSDEVLNSMWRWIKLHFWNWDCPRINSNFFWRMDPQKDALFFCSNKNPTSFLEICRCCVAMRENFPECKSFPGKLSSISIPNRHSLRHVRGDSLTTGLRDFILPSQAMHKFIFGEIPQNQHAHLLLSLIPPKKRVPFNDPCNHSLSNKKYLVATASSKWDSKPFLSSYQQQSKRCTYEDKSLNFD